MSVYGNVRVLPGPAVQICTALYGDVRQLPYKPAMAGTSRLELRVSAELKARVRAAADEAGQGMSTFGERALEAALRAAQAGHEGDVVAVSSRHAADVSAAPPRAFTPRPKGVR